MIGYLQIYYKIVGENETYYASFDGLFEKPFTRLKMRSLKKIIKKAYSEIDKIYSVEYCEKEEYEKGMKGQKKIKLSWEEGGE